ncbi:MAG: cytochrome ubiquinol oxidase subunit I [Firmicutes bacterium]|nr:cytochrome ubiquinol oxidase subunit I [Bacillota bacterium]
MDTVLLSRIQFAFTVGYHYLFVPLSLGLSLVVMLTERRYYKSGLEVDKAAAAFWTKLFTTTFAIGVATGITMEFAFGTNWANYSRFVGDIFGAPLAAEGLFAFFLESTFLGVLLFGRERVSKRFYYVSSWLVFIGAHLSALWIIIANSWQQTPAGFKVVDGRAVLTDFFAAALNPSTLPRYTHAVVATWVAGGFVAAGIAAYYLLQGRHIAFARRAIAGGLALALAASLAMPLLGHWSAIQVGQTQPAKMAAFEGIFKTENGAPMALIGWVDEKNQTVRGIKVPYLLSLLLTLDPNGRVTGLDQFAPGDRPPLQLTFQSYHLMILLGLYFVGLAAFSLYLLWRRKLESTRWVLKALLYSIPLPILASQVGWMAAEVGRQPWIVYGQLRTVDAVSAVVPASHVATTLAVFVALYGLLFVGWLRIALGIIRKGPALSADIITGEAGIAQAAS